MHVMLDLETMGTGPNAPIVAIGACRFDQHGVDVGGTFYRTIGLKSAQDSGAMIDADTVIWWLNQSDAARQQITTATGDFAEALEDFRFWFECGHVDGVWGNGASFDNAILTQSYLRIGQEAPWPFWLDRCYRTVKAFSAVKMERQGTHHNALDDAISQAKHLVAIWANEGVAA